MSQSKPKRDPPEVEIHWDVLQRQQGDLELLDLHPAPEQNTKAMSLLRRRFNFGGAEVEANRLGQLTQRQQKRFLILGVLRGGFFILVALYLSQSIYSFFKSPDTVDTVTFIGSCFLIVLIIILAITRIEYNVNIKSFAGYLLPYKKRPPHLHLTNNIEQDGVSSIKLRFPVSINLYEACEQNYDLYRIYYTAKTEAILSVERVEP